MAAKEKSKIKNQKSKIVKEKVSEKKGVSVTSFSASGTKSTTTLPKEIFGQKPNVSLLAQAVRVFLSNQRSAHAKTKTRAEVSFSTRKIFSQKGTGHARHGAKSAPIFVHGGVAHGPNGEQNYKLEMPKKMKKQVMTSALSAKVLSGKLFIADMDKLEAKTKLVAQIFKKMGVAFPATIVHDGSPDLYRAARNLCDLNLVTASQLTAYEVLAPKSLILTKNALKALETRLLMKEGK